MNRTVTRRRSADAGVVAAGSAARASVPSVWPQLAQKRASLRFGAPQCGQVAASGLPQLSQNLLPLRFSIPQLAQIMVGSVPDGRNAGPARPAGISANQSPNVRMAGAIANLGTPCVAAANVVGTIGQ